MNANRPTLIQQPAALETALAPWRTDAGGIALVPTMGNLHRAHLELIRRARTLARHVVVSIYVNPMQFDPGGDYHAYPRTLDADLKALGNLADLVFAPETRMIYPRGTATHTQVNVPELGEILCGAFRPGHFTGVATVVTVLFNLVRPELAVFGEKDFQQLQLIRRMTADLHLPVRIVAVPTVREADGLAISSRNGYLDPQQRAQAPTLYAILEHTANALRIGDVDTQDLESRAMKKLQAAGFRPEYVSIRDAATLGPPRREDGRIVFAAAWLGRARLIDNLRID